MFLAALAGITISWLSVRDLDGMEWPPAALTSSAGTIVDMADAEVTWAELDEPWQRAFALAWDAVVTGNIGVGAVVCDPGGSIVSEGRNRVADSSAPVGQVAGSSLAHAEVNALAQLRFRSPRTLELFTTLQPCLQCSAAIRMAPIATVQMAGADPLWEGCNDFGRLNPWAAQRGPVPTTGPRSDEIGVFATLLARIGPGLIPRVEDALRTHGQSRVIDLAKQVQDDGTFDGLRSGSVRDAFACLWPRLRDLATPE